MSLAHLTDVHSPGLHRTLIITPIISILIIIVTSLTSKFEGEDLPDDDDDDDDVLTSE